MGGKISGWLKRLAADHGPSIGIRGGDPGHLGLGPRCAVYALLGLVKRWGPQRVEAACAPALDAESCQAKHEVRPR